VIGDDIENYDDEGARGAADLETAAAQGGIRKPTTTAVTKPLSGVVPLAIAKAMAKGKATIATVKPAIMSRPNFSKS
jgi:hypothetical protein